MEKFTNFSHVVGKFLVTMLLMIVKSRFKVILNYLLSFAIALSRFRKAKSADEEAKFEESGVPKSTRYKNKWAYGTFKEWQKQRLIKALNVEVSGLFKDYDFHLVQSLNTSFIEMHALSLNYLLSKLVQR